MIKSVSVEKELIAACRVLSQKVNDVFAGSASGTTINLVKLAYWPDFHAYNEIRYLVENKYLKENESLFIEVGGDGLLPNARERAKLFLQYAKMRLNVTEKINKRGIGIRILKDDRSNCEQSQVGVPG